MGLGWEGISDERLSGSEGDLIHFDMMHSGGM